MRDAPSPPAWCRTFAQREAWRAGFRAALQSVVTEQLSFEEPKVRPGSKKCWRCWDGRLNASRMPCPTCGLEPSAL